MNAERERCRKRTQRNYAASLMSDTKWRTVFSTLERQDLNLRQIIMKFSGTAKPLATELPSLHPPHPYVETSCTGPFPLIDLEWIEIPALARFPRANNLPAETFVQDINLIRVTLEETGKRFQFEESPEGLRIIGHAPRPTTPD